MTATSTPSIAPPRPILVLPRGPRREVRITTSVRGREGWIQANLWTQDATGAWVMERQGISLTQDELGQLAVVLAGQEEVEAP